MGFNGVYKSLQEIFPQIDARLLRAVAIENPKDPDEAAGIIINEIVPLLSERSKLPVSSPNKSITKDCADEKTYRRCDQMWNKEVDFKSYSMSQIVASVNATDRVSHTAEYKDDSNGQELPPIDIAENSYLVTGSSKMFNGESSGSRNEAGETVHQEKTDVNVSHGGLISDLISMRSKQPAEHDRGDAVNIILVPDEATDNSSLINFRNVPDQPLLHGHKYDFDINLMPDAQQNFDASTAEEHDLLILENVQECDPSALDVNSVVQPPRVDEGYLPNSEKQLVLEKESYFIKHDFSVNGDVDLECDSETDLVSQSSKVIKIDQLEEMINEAKTNKRMLFSSMESLMNLMKEAELKEKAAEEAKMEVAMAGSDTLVRVEELKEMLAHAKGANEMHAGEIYGEKAILATEMRELQSRLSSLSEERDRSLAILDEMCQSLESRLAAAEELKNGAEKEIRRKEEIAQNALAKQEAIMENVVQESNRLHQEAEENAKLRDFLIDRGHLVDMLQGEISVICQDVEILKAKFDANLPLNKSFTSAQTTCALASSSSSVRSVASDLIAEQNFLSETLKRSPSSSVDNLSHKGKLEVEEAKTDDYISPEVSPITSMKGLSQECRLEPEVVNNDHKYLDDDDLRSWEIFPKDIELAM